MIAGMKNPLRSEIFYFISQGGFFIALLLVTITIVIGFIPIRHPWISQKAVSSLRAMGADSCTVASVEIIAWREIEFKDISFKVTIDSLNEYQIKMSKAVVPVNLIRLLIHRKQIKQAFHSGNVGFFTKFVLKPHLIVSDVVSLGNILDEGKDGYFENVWLTIKTGGKIAFLGAGGTVTITAGAAGEKKNDNIAAHIQFPVVSTYGDGIQNMHSTVILKPDGTLVIQDISGKYFDGKLRVQGMIALSDSLRTTYVATIDRMDMAYWYSVHVGVGEVAGVASVHCQGDRIPFMQLPSMLNYTMTVNKCTVNNLPLQQSLATSLFIPSLRTCAFDRMILRMRTSMSDTVYAALDGSGSAITFNAAGWLLTDGKIQQRIEGSFSETMVKGFPREIQPILASGNDRGWKFKCRLYGTLSDPRFELDKETLQRAVGSMFTNVQQEIMEKLLQ
jgi:hypothetical protein